MAPQSDQIYYFLGNITSHILHALPLQKELGGTFVVLSDKAKKEVEKYNVPVIAIDNQPFQWQRFGFKLKPIHHYLRITNRHHKTVDFLNIHAKVVLFYELYDFDQNVRLTNPKTVFLTHGNMLKDYMGSGNRLTILEQYDHMAALGPHLKQEFIKKNHIPPQKLIDVGISRTDEIVKHRGEAVIPTAMIKELDIDPAKKIVSYLPTFWGASSIYTTGLDVVRYFPEEHILFFRPHPQTPKKILNRYLEIIKEKPNVFYLPEGKYKSTGLLDIYAASSAIIGDVSSVMLEAILTFKPLVFAYDTADHSQGEQEYRAIKDVVRNSHAVTPNTQHDIPNVINESLTAGINESLWQKTAESTFFQANGGCTQAIATFVRTLISRP